jgi:hypothetical protein
MSRALCADNYPLSIRYIVFVRIVGLATIAAVIRFGANAPS